MFGSLINPVSTGLSARTFGFGTSFGGVPSFDAEGGLRLRNRICWSNGTLSPELGTDAIVCGLVLAGQAVPRS